VVAVLVVAAMADPEDDDFLSRWSRRKRGEHPEDAAAEPAAQVAEVDPSDGEGEGDPEVIAQLPDIDGMDDSSDFAVFLQAGVPEALRRRALRKLWRVNPVLANLDGLNDYDEDYTQLSAMGKGMKTLYRVGEGFATDEEDVLADAETQSDVTDDPKSEVSEPPAAIETENQAAMVDAPPGRAAPPAQEPAAPADNPKGTARSRRWGASERQS